MFCRKISYTMLSWSAWANIAQENYFFNIDPHPTNNRNTKIINSLIWIYLGQQCTRKLLVQCWPRVHRQNFTGKATFSNKSLFSCSLIMYIFTKQSHLISFNVGSGVHLPLTGQQWVGFDTLTGTEPLLLNPLDLQLFLECPELLELCFEQCLDAISSSSATSFNQLHTMCLKLGLLTGLGLLEL